MSRCEPKVRWWSATTRSLSRFAPARRPHARRRLRLECLEDRTMLSTIALSVNTLLDDPTGVPISGYTTLRDAITQADFDTANPYVITFAVTGTIDLNSPLPDLNNNIDIEGPGAADLTVQRDPNLSPYSAFSVFTVNSGATVSLFGLTISGGYYYNGIIGGGGLNNSGAATVSDSVFSNDSGGYGGAIDNQSGGTLKVTDSTFSNNNADGGGGIFNWGTTTVTGSTFTGNNVEGGGGLYNNGGTTTVSDSTFTDNSAGIDGGGICSDAGVVIVNNTTFTGNSAFGNGGAVFVSSSGSGTAPGMTVTDSTFTDNCGFDGGGIFNDDGSTLVVTGSAFLNNSASNGTYGIGYGGGIFNFGTAAVSNSTFTSNAASNGGGIFNTLDYGGAGVLTITGSTFTNNSVTVNSNPVGPGGPCNGAGGGVCNEGIAMVTNSTFTGNTALTNNGGGIANVDTLMASDNTFTGNSATNGGGIDNESGGTATLTNCTVSGNTSQDAGGGIYNVDSLTLNNTIVAGNTSPIDNDISGTVTSTSAFNLIGDGSGIFNLTDLEEPALSNLIGTTADPLNPLLGPLADYGGPTETMALLPGSPAIDAGSNALAVDANGNPLTTDQRGAGFPRVINGTVDIGAFESQGFTLTPVTGSTPQGTPVNSAFANPLAVIVTANNALEPVAGGIVTFSAPASGASAGLSTTNPVTIGSNGQASVMATANAIGGQYTVSASTAGAAAPASFVLTNQTTLTVNTLADYPSGPIPGYTTLRDAITQADSDTANPYVITFSVTGTIDLTSPLPALNNDINLDGPGASDLTVQRLSSAPDFSVFTVDSGATVSLSGMTISGGDAVDGGGLYNAGTLTVTNGIFADNSASSGGGLVNSYGGGLYNVGILIVSDSTFSNNSSVSGSGFYSPTGNGGGLYNAGTATVTDNIFTNNSASLDFHGNKQD